MAKAMCSHAHEAGFSMVLLFCGSKGEGIHEEPRISARNDQAYAVPLYRLSAD